ncbi:probable 28S ribosomal protein S25, mitochondrial [Sitodiplosis mosellana]|uniref:probable 28S ribosomal protein S25, mitochondrial n=1 Tax=Sitodiplosis mosellana TaxID=263140 RepID=UPI00244510BC|nr:probable 28S ribosomal protein S25, mitochondrial [Sitodiplosis mosellana]
MPFMIGPAPIRRTKQYLSYGKLYIKDKIKIMSINYNEKGDHHQGARDFVFWYVPQIQYKNPNVQIVSFKNLTPSPFIRCFYENGKELIIDVDSKKKEEILSHCLQTIGKSSEQIQAEKMAAQKKENPSIFGVGCERACICMVPGQLPCPGIVKLPDHMRGKLKWNKD